MSRRVAQFLNSWNSFLSTVYYLQSTPPIVCTILHTFGYLFFGGKKWWKSRRVRKPRTLRYPARAANIRSRGTRRILIPDQMIISIDEELRSVTYGEA